MLKVSIITVVYNNDSTIADAIESVLNQSYPNIEYIIIDGGSTDKTLQVIKRYSSKIDKLVSEPDKGLYDAMNKGVLMASGDLVGILNSDDLYYDSQVIERVVNALNTQNTDSVFGDMIYVRPNNINKVVRYYRSNNFKINDFKKGVMPGHASFFVRRAVFQKFGLYNIRYKISADFDLLLRFLYIHKISYTYLPKTLIKMRMGGISTRGLSSIYLMNKENLMICESHSVKTSLLRIYTKYLFKILQFIKRPK